MGISDAYKPSTPLIIGEQHVLIIPQLNTY